MFPCKVQGCMHACIQIPWLTQSTTLLFSGPKGAAFRSKMASSHRKDTGFSMCLITACFQPLQNCTDFVSILSPPCVPPSISSGLCPLYVCRWSYGWSDLWIKSSASSSSSSWSQGPCSWLCCSPLWFLFLVELLHRISNH